MKNPQVIPGEPVFSDTVVLAMPFQSDWNQQAKSSYTSFFVIACAFVNRSTFEIGLPLRGVIHTGSFLLGSKCLFGKAIIEAYKLANTLDLAACVFSPAALEYLRAAVPASDKMEPFMRGLTPEWELPMKHNSPLRLATLNWLSIRMGGSGDIGDIEAFVKKQFLAHGKQIDERVQPKVANTVRLLSFWKSNSKRASSGAGIA